MQKVVGSNPIIRSIEAPPRRGFSFPPATRRGSRRAVRLARPLVRPRLRPFKLAHAERAIPERSRDGLSGADSHLLGASGAAASPQGNRRAPPAGKLSGSDFAHGRVPALGIRALVRDLPRQLPRLARSRLGLPLRPALAVGHAARPRRGRLSPMGDRAPGRRVDGARRGRRMDRVALCARALARSLGTTIEGASDSPKFPAMRVAADGGGDPRRPRRTS